MRRSTLTMMVIAGLLFIGLLAFPSVSGALGGESADRSMVTTESGETEFFLDREEGSWFIIDVIFGNERTMDVKLHVTNPDSNSHNVEIFLNVPEDEDWEFGIKEVWDSEGSEITEDSEVVEGTNYTIMNLQGGDQVTVVLEASYLGDSSDAEEYVTLHAAISDGGAPRTPSRSLNP